MLKKEILVVDRWEGIREGCYCARCSCLRLQREGNPETQAESWLLRQGWPEDHDDYTPRMQFIRTFGFAVPTRAAIRLISRYSPILEVGAGTGYWAMELAQAGVNIAATDPTPGMYLEGSSLWSRIDQIGGTEALDKYPGRNLLICWPEMAAWPGDVVNECSSKHIIYVGEPRNGCTGNGRMFEILEKRYLLEEGLEIPRFSRIRDRLEVWRRR